MVLKYAPAVVAKKVAAEISMLKIEHFEQAKSRGNVRQIATDWFLLC